LPDGRTVPCRSCRPRSRGAESDGTFLTTVGRWVGTPWDGRSRTGHRSRHRDDQRVPRGRSGNRTKHESDGAFLLRRRPRTCSSSQRLDSDVTRALTPPPMRRRLAHIYRSQEQEQEEGEGSGRGTAAVALGRSKCDALPWRAVPIDPAGGRGRGACRNAGARSCAGRAGPRASGACDA
jgi:hypothetical protein